MVHDLRMKRVSMPVIPSYKRVEARLAEVRALARKLEILLVTAAEMDAIDYGGSILAKQENDSLDDPANGSESVSDGDREGGTQ